MSAVTAQMVKDLRDRTNLPMMKCKQALEAAAGDTAAAIEWLRKQGIAAADKKGDRLTANGGLGLALKNENGSGAGALALLACETDFVSGNDVFKEFAKALAESALASGVADVDAFKAQATIAGAPVGEALAGKIQQLGENMQVVKIARLTGPVVTGYNHGGKIAVLVAGTGDAQALRMIALHVASANPAPVSLDRAGVDQALVKKEEEIIASTPEVQAKPEAMRPKIVQGKLGRFFREVVLSEQEMLLDNEKNETVEQYAKRKGLTVSGFVRINA